MRNIIDITLNMHVIIEKAMKKIKNNIYKINGNNNGKKQQTTIGNRQIIEVSNPTTAKTIVYSAPISNAPIGPPTTDNIKKNHMAAKWGMVAIPIGINPVTSNSIQRTNPGGHNGIRIPVIPISIIAIRPNKNNGG